MGVTLLPGYVAGAIRPGGGGRVVEDITPSDAADVVSLVRDGAASDVGDAVDAAVSAIGGWRRQPGVARAERPCRRASELASRARYGLSAPLFTRDLGAALEYIGRIEADMVRVNGDRTGVDAHAPFGGVKASGSGAREQGSAAREFYTGLKAVQVSI